MIQFLDKIPRRRWAGPAPRTTLADTVENLHGDFQFDCAKVGPRFRRPDEDNAFGRAVPAH
jgi:hypothetical protein